MLCNKLSLEMWEVNLGLQMQPMFLEPCWNDMGEGEHNGMFV
jgi:hypothetical protein